MGRFFLFAALSVLVAQTALASPNLVVGTCKPKLTSFSTIQAAVSAAQPGATILVCPGVYPEQVTITQSVNLQGIADNNLDQVLIAVPSGGLTVNVTSAFGEPVAAQVLVQGATGVNLNNITVDGTGGDQGCGTTGTWLAGIFYASNSSGSVSRVRASGQIDGGCGVGIWAENASASPSLNITIEGNSVHDVDGVGISVASTTPPSLNVDIRNNYVSSHIGVGIFANSVSGDIDNNDVNDAVAGLFDWAPMAMVSYNQVTLTTYGALLLGAGTLQFNDIRDTGFGVFLDVSGATIQNNRITFAANAGIEFNCQPENISHNNINDAAVGFADVPAGFSGFNTFSNTATISTGGCVTTTAAVSKPGQAMARVAPKSSFANWRTPTNPHGTRR